MKLDNGTNWPDLDEALEDAAWKARYAPETLTPADAMRLAGVVEVYWHLATHPAGTEAMIKSLRSLRRAVAAARRSRNTNGTGEKR